MKYTVTAPDGKKYVINDPEGQGQEAALSHFKSQWEGGNLQPSAPTQPTEEPSMPIGEMFGKAKSHLYRSGKNMASDLAQVLIHPIDTAKSMYGLAKGTAQLLIPGKQANEEQAMAVGRFFKDRYGSFEKTKQTFAEDPVGFAADLSTLMTGGGLLAAKSAQMAGKLAPMSRAAVPIQSLGATQKGSGVLNAISTAGNKVADFGRAIDPITRGGKIIGGLGKGLGKGAAAIGGSLTGIGHSPYETAFPAATRFKGSKAFKEGFKNTGDADSLVQEAVDAVSELKNQRMIEYRADLSKLQKSNPKVDYKPVLQAMKDQAASMYDLATGKHHIVKNAAEKAKLRQIAHEIMTVVGDPAMHNALGFDHLKRVLNESIDIDPNKMKHAFRAKTVMANVVREQIVKSVREYDNMMKKYQHAKGLEDQLRSTFSIPERGLKIETALKKLQGALRNNVNTGMGQRKDLLKAFDKTGRITEKLAGQAFNELTPRGIQKFAGPAGAFYLGSEHGLEVGLGLLGLESPKVSGALTYGLGRAAMPFAEGGRLLGPTGGKVVGHTAFQAGRATNEDKKKKKADGKITLQKSPSKKKKDY